MKQILIFSVLFCLVTSCNPCRNEEVPAVQLFLAEEAKLEKLIVKNRHVQGVLIPGHYILLPFSLDSDTTTFYFQTLNGRVTDTLSIGYTRRAVFEDGGCGFYLSIVDPVVLPRTTFDSLEIHQEESFSNIYISVYE